MAAMILQHTRTFTIYLVMEHCDVCKYRERCERTMIQLCKLEDYEHVEIVDGRYTIVRDWI